MTTVPPPPPFTVNVENTNRFGLDNVGGMMLYETVTTPSTAYGYPLRVQANYAYTGGNGDAVVSPNLTLLTVQPGVVDNAWAGLDILNNYAATVGRNVARYSQGNRMTSTTGSTWAGVAEARDHSGNAGANPTTTLTGFEIDNFANGGDEHKQRIGLLVVAGRHDPAGEPNTVAYGILISPANESPTEAIIIDGLSTIGNYVDTINLTRATASHAAVWIGDNQKVYMDTAGTRYLTWNGAHLVFVQPGKTTMLA